MYALDTDPRTPSLRPVEGGNWKTPGRLEHRVRAFHAGSGLRTLRVCIFWAHKRTAALHPNLWKSAEVRCSSAVSGKGSWKKKRPK